MKKIAILVIAAVNQPVYISYIRNYWTSVIQHTNAHTPHIDVFLLLENGTPMREFEAILPNVIVDPNSELDELCPRQFQQLGMPGILSKTIHALDVLKDEYDVFFRTNLSSFIKIAAFDQFIQSKKKIIYSGAWVWADGLRNDLIHHDKIGPTKSIKDLTELDRYDGNTFISGAGYFLNSSEARSLVKRKELIRYDIVDDVSVGLMFSHHEMLPGFARIVTPELSAGEIADLIRASNACHIRLQRFPVLLAEELWLHLRHQAVWT